MSETQQYTLKKHFDSVKYIAESLKSYSEDNVSILTTTGAICRRELFIGLISGIGDKLERPITFIQRDEENSTSEMQKYTRFESRAFAYRGHHSPFCSHIKKEEASDPYMRCSCIDNTITNLLLGDDGAVLSLEDVKAQATKKLEGVEIGNFEADTFEDKIYIRYTCKITGYTEIAIPFVFNGKVRGVIISGQFVIKEKREALHDAYIEELKAYNEEYNDIPTSIYNLRIPDEYTEWLNKNEITNKDLNDFTPILFQELRGVKEELNRLLISEVKLTIDNAHADAYAIINDININTSIDIGNFFNECSNMITDLKEKTNEAFSKLCSALHCGLVLYMCENIRILENSPIILNRLLFGVEDCERFPKHILFNANKPCTLINGAVDISDISNWIPWVIPCENDDYKWRVIPESVETDYPVIICIDKSAMEVSWRNADFIPLVEIARYFEKTVCSLADFIRSRGVEIGSRFTAMRLASFTAVTRHEIGQKTAAMSSLLELFGQDRQALPLLKRNGLDTRIVDNFVYDVQSHVETVALISNAGRYVTGIPTPEYELFSPYFVFLNKWRKVFKTEELNKKIKVQYPDLRQQHPRMEADVGQIEQVVYNLTGNAIKHSHTATKVYINCKLDITKTWYVYETLNFSYPISLDNQRTVFNYGKRGNKNKNHGEGLGLYISQSIAESHNGTLSLHESAATIISPYNLPMLYYYQFLPDAWKNNNTISRYALKNIVLTKESIENEINRIFSLSAEEFAELYLHTCIINVIDYYELHPMINRIPTVYEIFLHPKCNDLYEFNNPAWYFRELQKPTAAINFVLKIPYRRKRYE